MGKISGETKTKYWPTTEPRQCNHIWVICYYFQGEMLTQCIRVSLFHAKVAYTYPVSFWWQVSMPFMSELVWKTGCWEEYIFLVLCCLLQVVYIGMALYGPAIALEPGNPWTPMVIQYSNLCSYYNGYMHYISSGARYQRASTTHTYTAVTAPNIIVVRQTAVVLHSGKQMIIIAAVTTNNTS